MKNNHEIKRQTLENYAAALDYVADVVTTQIVEVVGKFDGKQGNKKLIQAIETATDGLCHVSSYPVCGEMQFEIYYTGPAWWMQCDGDKRPRPYRDITAAMFLLDGQTYRDRVRSDSLRTYEKRYKEEAADLKSAASGNDPLIEEYNNALECLKTAYDKLPLAVKNIYYMNPPSVYFNEIDPE